MKNFTSYREAGWAQLAGKWGQAAIFTLVYFLISALVLALESSIWEYTIVTAIFVMPMSFSYNIAILDNKRTSEPFNIEKLFVGYKDFLRIVGTGLLISVYVFLWSLLLYIPGIIKSISYSQTFYILKDNPDLSFDAAIERSIAMMKGHKWEYFCLTLTFIGWVLLVIITFGIAGFWVTPYMSATFADYYEDLKAEFEQKAA